MVAWSHVLEQNMATGAFGGGKRYLLAKQEAERQGMQTVSAFLCFSDTFIWSSPTHPWLTLSGTGLIDTLRDLPHHLLHDSKIQQVGDDY